MGKYTKVVVLREQIRYTITNNTLNRETNMREIAGNFTCCSSRRHLLLKNYQAIVPAFPVIYILELISTSKATLFLPEHDHLKILQIFDECEI